MRADNLRKLTPAGWDALLGYGVRTVVDLRRPAELAVDPPGSPPLRAINIDLCPLEAGADVDPDIRAAYLDILATQSGNFARVIGAVARAPEGAVAVHCLAGRDRTGLVVALLLRLASVDAGTIAADFAESDLNLAVNLAAWVAEAPDPAERERRRAWTDAPLLEVMDDVLAELEERHGGAAAYLRSAGVEDDELELARARLRG